jgi:hypothetical protein
VGESIKTIEAYTIEIKYYFDENGVEYVSVEPSEDMSSTMLVGVLEMAKFHIRFPPEEDED